MIKGVYVRGYKVSVIEWIGFEIACGKVERGTRQGVAVDYEISLGGWDGCFC